MDGPEGCEEVWVYPVLNGNGEVADGHSERSVWGLLKGMG